MNLPYFFLLSSLLLIATGCQKQELTLTERLKEKWDANSRPHISLFDFSTIEELDSFQYEHKIFYVDTPLVAVFNDYGVPLIASGNSMKSDLLCSLPLAKRNRIIFQFSNNGKEVFYKHESIEFSGVRDSVFQRFSYSNDPQKLLIEFAFENQIDTIVTARVMANVYEGFLSHLTSIVEQQQLAADKYYDETFLLNEILRSYRPIFAISRTR
jgi:hypothetical protein